MPEKDPEPLPEELQPKDVITKPGLYICKHCLTRQAAIPKRRLVGDWVLIWCDVCRKTREAGPV